MNLMYLKISLRSLNTGKIPEGNARTRFKGFNLGDRRMKPALLYKAVRHAHLKKRVTQSDGKLENLP